MTLEIYFHILLPVLYLPWQKEVFPFPFSRRNSMTTFFLYLNFFLPIFPPKTPKKEHLSYLRRRRSMQLNLQEKQQAEQCVSAGYAPPNFCQGFKSAYSESNLYQGDFYAPRQKAPSSPKLCNFMREFEYGSMPSKIHVI